MRQCVNVILTRIFSVINIKVGMPQTILRKHNIQRAQYLYNDSIGIELQVLERNNASRKIVWGIPALMSITLNIRVSITSIHWRIFSFRLYSYLWVR